MAEKQYHINSYSAFEENLNIKTHLFGIFLSIIGLIFLMIKAFELNDFWVYVSFPIFGISMILLYLASTLYHSAKVPKQRFRLKIFDHAAIFLLIAGTYTPYTLVTLREKNGWIIFAVVWSIAIVGIIFKLFFAGKYKLFSTFLYVAMGWIVVFYFKTLSESLHPEGVKWLLYGGAAYTVGAVLYSIKKLKLNHALFHVFVLLGTICHFISIYFYVTPVS